MAEMVERFATALGCAPIFGGAETLREALAMAIIRNPRNECGPSRALETADLMLRDAVERAFPALREPTQAMVEAGLRDGGSHESERDDFVRAWPAMIDEALK